jgi:hypothetical protein
MGLSKKNRFALNEKIMGGTAKNTILIRVKRTNILHISETDNGKNKKQKVYPRGDLTIFKSILNGILKNNSFQNEQTFRCGNIKTALYMFDT